MELVSAARRCFLFPFSRPPKQSFLKAFLLDGDLQSWLGGEAREVPDTPTRPLQRSFGSGLRWGTQSKYSPALLALNLLLLDGMAKAQPKFQVERDFEREYGKLQQLEDQTKKLQKDMKKSTDADLAMSKSAVKISSDLLSNPLCEQEPGFLEMVTAFDTAMKRMDSFNQEKVNQIQKTVIEPLKKFSSVFPSLNMAVKRREQTLQDYKRLQSKVEKYEEKERTGPVLAKLHQAREELRPVKEDFEAKNKQLLEEMPKFYSSRIDYFKPSFESLVRAQVVYYTEMHKIFGDLTAQIDRPGLSDEQRERENDAKLSELRALSIVADD
ncbi:bridging integrator 3 isoform X1 [Strix aluco]|uniref:bridging integrator 3 isoform X1 n=1 Tax=Strix aluco TaxID=111821 RepID=UPI003DA514A3